MKTEANKSADKLYNYAMGQLMASKAKTHGKFFTQKEFEENKSKIFEITLSKTKLDQHFNPLNQ